MGHETEAIDPGVGMAAATIAPALAGSFVALMVGGPAIAVYIFGFAFVIAALHVLILAVPLYGLLTLLGWRPGLGTALLASVAIGALPAALLLAPQVAPWGAVFGLIGGLAFCAMSTIRCDEGETGQE